MQQIMQESIQILLVPVTVLGSVLFVCSCLFFKRFRKKNRNASASVPDKKKSGKTRDCNENSKVKGITNTAFTVDGNAGIYENDANQYDYAKNERKSNIPGKDTTSSDLSPTYDDVTDTETRFYFTLERCPPDTTGITEGCARNPGNTRRDEDTYVVVIPENIYDNPEGTEEDTIAEDESANVQGASQFYHTLEEYSEQNESSGGTTYDMVDGDNRMQDDISIEIEKDNQMQTGDEDTYVVNIPNKVHGMKNKPPIKFADQGHAVYNRKQEQATEEEYVVNIPNDASDFQKVSPNNKGKGYLRRIEKEDEKTEGNSRHVGIEKGIKEFRKNKGKEEDKENNDDGDDDDYVIPASEENDENNGHFDEAIYENWENNIIGRARSVSGESGDEIYLNETVDVMKEQDQDSACGSLYQNLTEFRQSLVLLDAR